MCGGRCCQDFDINVSPERLGELYIGSVARIVASEELIPYDWDIVRVAEMVIRIDEPDEALPRYTCRHFDEANGVCGDYDNRPAMCREYPYAQACHCGLTNPAFQHVAWPLDPNAPAVSASSL